MLSHHQAKTCFVSKNTNYFGIDHVSVAVCAWHVLVRIEKLKIYSLRRNNICMQYIGLTLKELHRHTSVYL